MPVNRRKEITEYLVTQLKLINGSISTFDATYTYNTNVFNNVERKLRFLDEINDFPSLYLTPGAEFRKFESQNLTIATLPVIIRAYVYSGDNSQEIASNLLEDIEHVIYNIGDHPDMGIHDITIESIQPDAGLLAPYGIVIIELSIVYRLED